MSKNKPSPASDAPPYRKIYITTWHDPGFKKLSANGQHVYLLLCTGPQTESLPLLQIASAGILETYCPALGYDNIKSGLAELRAAGFADYADDAPVIALPKFAAEERCNSYSRLTGWLKVYRRIPDGAIKSKYLPTLPGLIDFTADSAKNPLRKTWDDFFGKGSGGGSPGGYQGPVSSDQGSVSSDQLPVSGESVPDSGESGAHAPLVENRDSNKPTEADFAQYLYAEYPRKEGKKKGIEACKEKIQNWDDLWHAHWGIQQYKHEIKKSDEHATLGSDWAKQTPKHFDKYITTDSWLEAAERFVEIGCGVLEMSRHASTADEYSFRPQRRLADAFDHLNAVRVRLGADELDDAWQNKFWIVVRLCQGHKPDAIMARIDETADAGDVPGAYVEKPVEKEQAA